MASVCTLNTFLRDLVDRGSQRRSNYCCVQFSPLCVSFRSQSWKAHIRMIKWQNAKYAKKVITRIFHLADCGPPRKLTARNGTFHSPNYPCYYSHDPKDMCRWTIAPDPRDETEAIWIDFDVFRLQGYSTSCW